MNFGRTCIMRCGFVGLMKIFAWQMMHRHSIRRDLRRLEPSLAELSGMLKSR